MQKLEEVEMVLQVFVVKNLFQEVVQMAEMEDEEERWGVHWYGAG